MENARKFVGLTLESNSEHEFVLDLGKSDRTLEMIIEAFEEIGCKVKKDKMRPGWIKVTRPGD